MIKLKIERKKNMKEKWPRVGCAAVVVGTHGGILLGKRGKEPNKFMWVFPGGGVEFGESMEQTLKREILEETGLRIFIGKLIYVYEIINPPNEHRILIFWWAYRIGGALRPSSDLLDASFFSVNNVWQLAKENKLSRITIEVLDKIKDILNSLDREDVKKILNSLDQEKRTLNELQMLLKKAQLW